MYVYFVVKKQSNSTFEISWLPGDLENILQPTSTARVARISND